MMKNKRMTVLVAMRDEAIARQLCRAMEEGMPCRMYAVTDGEEAVRAAERLRPDVVVIDCILPGLDGPAVIDRIRQEGYAPEPRIIGGAMLPFAERSLRVRGVRSVLPVPWRMEELVRAVAAAMNAAQTAIDWDEIERLAGRAERLLCGMGVQPHLRGYAYLAHAAALACGNEEKLHALRKEIYAPVAAHFGTTEQSVERLIRHAVERAMDAPRAGGIYNYFGNTIDPMRGKPTNAQAIGMIAERLRTQRRAGRD